MSKELILEHNLVPTHEIISEEEAKTVLFNLGITSERLPKIPDTDPVAKLIKAKKGKIIKITRRSPTSKESIYYRLVI